MSNRAKLEDCSEECLKVFWADEVCNEECNTLACNWDGNDCDGLEF